MLKGDVGDNVLKIGVVGGGHIVQHRHIPVFKKIANVEVFAVCDKDAKIAKDGVPTPACSLSFLISSAINSACS